ncbi:hypothetical protein R9C00_14755 [Flammeovirgaceae bacterium SG7u.111]|nr:hypothetical protein [Flammeovirgaceae bacterium SG7u.132]WPO38719.1 hypothetical protein R9C00_14755 [Flammeovirgaceae bacterium SG7u.111]
MSENKEEKIMCPKCTWEPDGGDYWQCHCMHVWNTFNTYGKCPACGHVHKTTQCPACSQLSPHADWYLELDSIPVPEGEEKIERKES